MPVDVVERSACFDAGDVVGVPAGGAEAEPGAQAGVVTIIVGVAGFEDELVDGRGAGGGDKEFEAGFAGGIVAVDRDIGVGDADGAGLIGEEVGDGAAGDWPGNSGEQSGGCRAVEGEPVRGLAEIGDMDVFGDDVGGEAGLGPGDGVDIEIEEGAVAKFDESEVGVDAALAVQPESPADLERLEAFELLGEHAVEETQALRAGDLEDAAAGAVKENAAFADGGVFEFELAERLDDEDVGLGGAIGDQRCFGLLVEAAERADAHEGG